jgi:PAS domain S-box-containing protein
MTTGEPMLDHTTRTILLPYGGAVGFTALAVLLRWLLDPWLGEHWATVTVYGAVAATVWYGGYRPALVAAVLGYLGCNSLFMEPRGFIALKQPYSAIGLVLYLFTCSLIIGFGEALRVAQRRIREGQDRLRTTLASIGDAVITTDTEGRITTLNAVAESMTGWTQAEAVGKPLDAVFRIVNEDTRKGVENPAKRALREGVIVGLANDAVLIRKDGTERPIEDSAAPIRDAQGRVLGCVLVFRDITERRRAVQQLSDEMSRIESIVNHAIDGIIAIDENGTVEAFNPAAERLFGYRAEKVIGQNVKMLMPEPFHSEHDGYIANYLRTGQAKIIGIGREVEVFCFS